MKGGLETLRKKSSKLVDAIRRCVKAYPKSCVNISGGIDSTIILHHLNEKTDEQIFTYTIGFPDQPSEFEPARKVADHYGTKHTEIVIDNMLPTFSEILQCFSQPRFNLWPWWLAQQAHADGRLCCYIGEGGDEHFGGYWYKPQKTYLEHWAGFFTYVYSTYKTVYDSWGLRLLVPMHPANLDYTITYPHYDYSHNKRLLRKAYKNILPDFVVNRKKLNGRFDYWVMWKQEMKPYFPEAEPKSEDEIRQLLNVWVTREWSRIHGVIPVDQIT